MNDNRYPGNPLPGGSYSGKAPGGGNPLTSAQGSPRQQPQAWNTPASAPPRHLHPQTPPNPQWSHPQASQFLQGSENLGHTVRRGPGQSYSSTNTDDSSKDSFWSPGKQQPVSGQTPQGNAAPSTKVMVILLVGLALLAVVAVMVLGNTGIGNKYETMTCKQFASMKSDTGLFSDLSLDQLKVVKYFGEKYVGDEDDPLVISTVSIMIISRCNIYGGVAGNGSKSIKSIFE